jgi:hypothetical protein
MIRKRSSPQEILFYFSGFVGVSVGVQTMTYFFEQEQMTY